MAGTQIKSFAGDIIDIRATGNCAGSIITLDGDIGSPSSLVEITADGDGTNFGIYSIEADAIYADITGPDDQCGEAIRSIYARSGVVSGSVSSICFSTDIDDDPGDTFGLNADTDLQDLFVDLDLNFGEHINVGGVIDEDTTIRVANSFSGKADVTIDDPAGLDGWASCNGWHVDKVLGLGESLTEVTLHHDGPIEREGTGMPVTIGRRALSQIGCTWTDVTSSFTVAMHPSGHEREIRIHGIFDDGYSYLIEPKPETGSDYLYRGGLDASVGKAGVKDYDFVPRVRRIQDTTLNGLLEPDDITEWLADPIDTTLDGVVDNADLIDITEAVANSGDW